MDKAGPISGNGDGSVGVFVVMPSAPLKERRTPVTQEMQTRESKVAAGA